MWGEGFSDRLVYSLVPSHSLGLAVTGLHVASAPPVARHAESTARLMLPSSTAQVIIRGPPHIQVSKGFGSLTSGQDCAWRWIMPGCTAAVRDRRLGFGQNYVP